MLEDAIDGVEELAHDGDQGLEFSFAARQELLVEGGPMRFMLKGEQGGPVEAAAQPGVAELADAGGRVDGSSRSVLARMEARCRHPVADVQVRAEQGEFGQ